MEQAFRLWRSWGKLRRNIQAGCFVHMPLGCISTAGLAVDDLPSFPGAGIH